MKYSDLDREIIVLSAVWDLIGSMVHYGHFVKKHRLEEAMLMFNTSECSRLFIIMLADFLSKPSEGTFTLKFREGEGILAETYLGNLLDIAAAPHFIGDVTLLQTSVQAFADWLDGSITVDKVWLPSIDREGAIKVQRKTYLKICGTLTKHGFTRLGNTVTFLINNKPGAGGTEALGRPQRDVGQLQPALSSPGLNSEAPREESNSRTPAYPAPCWFCAPGAFGRSQPAPPARR